VGRWQPASVEVGVRAGLGRRRSGSRGGRCPPRCRAADRGRGRRLGARPQRCQQGRDRRGGRL